MKGSITEKGQTLVFVVIGFLVFVAVLALVLDGGNAYAAKRQAQNAADAGALAGADYLCKHRNEIGVLPAAIAVAEDYAVLNDAVDPPIVYANLTNANVIVTATVTRTTFFAGVLGFNMVSPQAIAEAACRPPGVGVLPVAWSCRENVLGDLICNDNIGPCRDEADPKGLACTYVLMDSVKVKEKGGNCDPDITDPNDPKYCYTENDVVCYVPTAPDCNQIPPEGLIDCDLDNDCTDELMAGGARSWLDLDGGGGGANELKDWITGDEAPPEIQVHTWVPEESGVATSLFHSTAEYLVGKDVILPVFNKVCNGLPDDITNPETLAQCNAWTQDNMDIITGSTFNFHVIAFSAFHVTCVQTGKNKTVAEPGYFLQPQDKSCYGHASAVESGAIDDNDKSIEGYFVRENLGGYGGPGGWYDTGTFTVVLIR